MKIIQSFWSKPFCKRTVGDTGIDSNPVWYDKRFFYFSWAYSCLLLKAQYPQVTLYTDEIGKKILVDWMELPYDEVIVCLNNIDHLHEDLWAMGKVYVYGLQQEPFIHVDGDIFIYDQFRPDNNGVIFLHYEYYRHYYSELMAEIRQKFDYIPEVLLNVNDSKGYMSVNAGILGGDRTDLIKQYSEEAMRFLSLNFHHLNAFSDIKNLNIVFEQLLFYYLIPKANHSPYFPVERFSLAMFNNTPLKQKLVHSREGFRQLDSAQLHLQYRFQKEFPKTYHKVREQLLKSAF